MNEQNQDRTELLRRLVEVSLVDLLIRKARESELERDRTAAIYALGEVQMDIPRVILFLVGVIRSHENPPGVRVTAIEALGDLKVPDPEALKALASVCFSEEREAQGAAVKALGAIGAVDDEVVSALLHVVHYGEQTREALCSLFKLGLITDKQYYSLFRALP